VALHSGGEVVGCTITGNKSGGGVFFFLGGGVVRDSIVYGNEGEGSYGSNYYWFGTSGEWMYCCTTPDPGGEGNISSDPQFVDAAAGNYRLKLSSPCINAGTNLPGMESTTDFDGNPRIVDGIVDIGAFECQAPARIFITTEVSSVAADVTAISVAGTNNDFVVGGMWWSNAAANAGGSFLATPSWEIGGVPLEYGVNGIVVFGSNVAGEVAADGISVFRPEPFSIHVVKVTQPDACTTVAVANYVTVVTECDTNCAAQIGWGQTADGSGWAWTTNLPTTGVAEDVYTAAFSITPPVGTNYVAARWIHSYVTNYGWNYHGNTNAFALDSTLVVSVTAAPSQVLTHPWDFVSGVTDGVAVADGLTVEGVGGGVLRLDNVSHSTNRDEHSMVTFTLSTLGKQGVTFHARVRRDEFGPRSIELDYWHAGGWVGYPMEYPLWESGVWYTIGGRTPGDGADSMVSAQFRIVAYNATASELDLSSPTVTSVIPEPVAMALLLCVAAGMRRLHFRRGV